MSALEITIAFAKGVLRCAEWLPNIPERAFVIAMARRLIAELVYFEKARAWRWRTA